LTDLYSSNYWEFERYQREESLNIDKFFGNYLKGMENFYLQEKQTNNWTENDLAKQIVTDYISGMTDKFAINCMMEISIPKAIEFYPGKAKQTF
jgi:dGTP triphosphohydrolase